MESRDLLTVSEVAERSGFAPSAIRFYDKERLITASRTSGGQRRFERNVLRRLALFTSSRSGPASIAATTSAALCAGSETSPGMVISRREASSAAVASRSAARLASVTTVHARSSRAAATARPKPREPPVTIATGEMCSKAVILAY